MWVYNLIVNNIVRSKYIFVENDKIEIFSKKDFEDGLWKISPNI